MTVRIAVVDPLPMFACGLISTLRDDGHTADAPENILEWVNGPGTPVVLLTVAGGRDWALLADVLRVRPDTVAVTVLAEANHTAYARAVAAGAAAVLPRDASPAAVRDVVRAAVNGRSLLPLEVLRSIVAGGVSEESARLLSDDEIDWLRQLAQGTTVARLADRVGYSERMMFRLLSGLYSRLGVDNRTKALMRARDEGWL